MVGAEAADLLYLHEFGLCADGTTEPDTSFDTALESAHARFDDVTDSSPDNIHAITSADAIAKYLDLL